MSLIEVSQGQRVTLVNIFGGKGIRSKLYSMGLIPGVKFTVLKTGAGPVMVAIKDTRLAIGFNMARRIMVE
jgi:ferrous iron transport protein A